MLLNISDGSPPGGRRAHRRTHHSTMPSEMEKKAREIGVDFKALDALKTFESTFKAIAKRQPGYRQGMPYRYVKPFLIDRAPMKDEGRMRYRCQSGAQYRGDPKEIPLGKEQTVFCECGRVI
jgi:hypothetical protein